MSTKTKKKRVVHLKNPAYTELSKCGRDVFFNLSTFEVSKITCKTCRKAYDADVAGYRKAKRELAKRS